MMRRIVLSLSLLRLCVVPCYGSEDWPEYRGPSRDGHSQASSLVQSWSETSNVTWKTPIHDRGWSSPVVYGNQVWLTTASEDGHSLYVVCLDRDSGKILLDRKLFSVEMPRPLSNPVNSYATPSPVIEDGRVYIHFGSYGTACLDTETFRVVWQRRDLPCDHWRGPGSSPLLWEDSLILHMDGADVQYVVSLDKKTGRNRWVTFRSTDYADLDEEGRPRSQGDFRKAYNTASVIEFEGRAQLISPSAKAVYGYDPTTGEEIWQVRHGGHSSAARTLYSDGVVAINTGYMGSTAQMWAIAVDGEGDVTDSHVRWKYTRGVPKRSSPILVDGRIYIISGDGVASCVDFKTGREIWKGRVGGNHSASILSADGFVYFFSEEGETTVIRAGETFEIVQVNQLADGFMASPAVAGNALFLRTKSAVYRIER